jgi:PAS domain S-box-containing protein
MKNQSVTVNPLFRGHPPALAIDPAKLLSSIVDVICAIDIQGIFRYVSPSSQQLFGYTPDEMEGESFRHFIHPEDLEKTVQLVAQRTHDCKTSNFENRYIHKNGSVVSVIWSGRWDEADGLLYCVARDGSEKGEIAQRLLKAQHMARIANYEYDVVNGQYTYTSDTLFDIFGLDRNIHPQFTSELFWQMVHPDDMEMVRENIRQLDQKNDGMLEYRIVCPGDRIVYISRLREVVRDAAGTPVKTVGTIQDITDRKISELAVQQSEERFRSLVQNGNELIAVIDAQGNYSFVGSNVEHLLGYTAEELQSRNAFAYIHPDDAGEIVPVLQQVAACKTVTAPPFRFLSGSGEWRWVESTITNHLDNPAIRGLVVNSKDITEKKRQEDDLRESEQRFKALVKNGSDLIVVIDDKGNLAYCSDNAMRLLGYSHEELAGYNVFDLIHPDDLHKVTLEIETVLKDPANAKGVQHRFLHKNGDWVWLESKGTNHLLTQSIQGILVNSRNITDRVKLQKKLNREMLNKQKEITSAVIKAQEMERSQLGLELHDNVNQILTTVKLYNEMYLTGYMQDKELLVKATQYTQDCINEIRSISKRLSAPTLGRITLQDSVRELVDSINLTRRLEIIYVPKGVDGCCVSQDLHLAVYRIVQEGLNNIIKYSQAQMACIELFRRPGRLCLRINDNGQGFDTTARRMGIGITNMKTRAENLHGEFLLKSEPGKGCEIEISFPCDGCKL